VWCHHPNFTPLKIGIEDKIPKDQEL
jgi:hypothetical protein